MPCNFRCRKVSFILLSINALVFLFYLSGHNLNKFELRTEDSVADLTWIDRKTEDGTPEQNKVQDQLLNSQNQGDIWDQRVKFLSHESFKPSLQKASNEELKKLSLPELLAYHEEKLKAALSPVLESSKPHSHQIIIVSSWRSGSSFLEAIFRAHPGTFDIHEPLHQYGLVRLNHSNPHYPEASDFLHELLKCRIVLDDYWTYMKRTKFNLVINEHYRETCENQVTKNGICYNKAFFEFACSQFPRLLTKIVRANLNILESVLKDEILNPKVIFLVRDPRGTFSSRLSSVAWCTHLCKDVSQHCKSMVYDLEVFQQLKEQFPNKIFFLRYEDLALSPLNRSKLLMQEMDLDFAPSMEDFINSHISTDGSIDPLSTERISSERVTHWTKVLDLKLVKEIQNKCRDIMDKLGYLPVVDSLDNLSVKDVLKP